MLDVVEKPSTPNSPASLVVPDYELLRRIGHGAYGDVWLARSKATGIFRAAKIVWRNRFDEDRPFRREFEGIQRFERISREHPSQLALFHIGRNDAEGYFYYVMELADSFPGSESRVSSSAGSQQLGTRNSEPETYIPHTLRAELECGRLPATRVLEIGIALTEALAHLHSHGLVHRDVKPSNVIFVNGRPKLADIGLVTDASDQCSIVGTEGYLPPEGPGTPQADIFALGKVLYEAATGMDRREFPKLPDEARNWPDTKEVFELNEIILKACVSDAHARYPSAEALLIDLRLLGSGNSVKHLRARRERIGVAWRALRAVAAVVVAAAAGIFLWQIVTRQSAPAIVPINANAANAFSNGYNQLRLGTSDGFQKALTNFTDAMADPRYLAAVAGLFEAYLMADRQEEVTIVGRSERLDGLFATLEKIAPTNAETHAAHAIVLWLNNGKSREAESEFDQALKADPSLMVLTCYGRFLTQLGRDDDAHRILKLALKIDPTSPLVMRLLGECESGMTSPTNRDSPASSNAPTSKK